MSHHYLDAVHQGKNDWWRYLFGVLVIVFCGFFFGSLFAAIAGIGLLALVNPDPTVMRNPDQLEPLLRDFLAASPLINFVVQNLPFIALMLGIFLAVKLLHGRSFRSLISPMGQFSLSRFLTGYTLWFGLLGITLLVSYALSPGDFQWTFDPMQWGMLLIASLLLTPIQIAAEELFCRAYLMQGLGLLTRNRFVLVSLPSLLFALGHFSNPEMARGAVWMALLYWSLGVFLALLTLRDNRLELALGIHAAQNMFVLLVANTADSVLKTPSIWTIKETGDPQLSLIWLLAQGGLVYWLLFGRKSRRPVVDAE
ncbi:CPBP family intramembrane metalloprotease [filamentous cyanobacterium LEGE 11480]|uniref:CPBP family intramembrane metalloprotease n=1 Tax=Romeriopsis navalis LEGE 11480 TaxID=2777977 RepID=A0A928Z5I2_9CYAN|nr:CPBP family intramembrane glutamic endopeptidase [Romeriopsis navalis]MBE9031503.1 CPBP family intramembrane metalloprotease [Romeriopsis navalis LEGE 11480]